MSEIIHGPVKLCMGGRSSKWFTCGQHWLQCRLPHKVYVIKIHNCSKKSNTICTRRYCYVWWRFGRFWNTVDLYNLHLDFLTILVKIYCFFFTRDSHYNHLSLWGWENTAHHWRPRRRWWHSYGYNHDEDPHVSWDQTTWSRKRNLLDILRLWQSFQICLQHCPWAYG